MKKEGKSSPSCPVLGFKHTWPQQGQESKLPLIWVPSSLEIPYSVAALGPSYSSRRTVDSIVHEFSNFSKQSLLIIKSVAFCKVQAERR